MLFRVFLAAVVMTALAMAGAGHAAPASADGEAVMSAVHDHAGDGSTAHPHHDPGAGEETANGCSDLEHCLGCSAHCPAVALVEMPPIRHDALAPTRFAPLVGHRDPALLPPMERPPEQV